MTQKLILLAIIILFSQNIGAQETDPFNRLRIEAAKSEKAIVKLSEKKITRTNPLWKAVTKPAINNVPFTLTDKTGRPVSPNEVVTLPDGKKISAQEYITRLNAIEKKMNEKGQTLRSGNNEVVSKSVTSKEYLDNRIENLPRTIAPRKSGTQLKNYMKPELQIGSILLKPVEKYTSKEREHIDKNDFFLNRTGTVSVKSAGNRAPFVKPPLPGGMQTAGTPKPIKIIDETNTKEWSLGNPELFSAGIKGKLHRYIRICPFDPNSPGTSLSEFKFTAEGTVYGSVFGQNLNILNALGEYYAPQDTSKKMTAKIKVSVMGFSIFNISQNYSQFKNIDGFSGKEFDSSFPIEIPIGWGFDFVGKIGAKGRVGFGYEAGIYRTVLLAVGQPIVDIKGYAEAGIEFWDLVTIGVGGNLTFIKGDVELRAWAGIWVQNSGQIVVGVQHYFGYGLNILSGNLYGYIKLCLPWWLGGDCVSKSHEFYSWPGFTSTGTIAESNVAIALANKWEYEPLVMEMK